MRVKLPNVIAAVLILIGWAMANEYIHCAWSIVKGVLFVEGYIYASPVFEAGIIIMGAVALGAATYIVTMGTMK